jgi:Na+-transporting NADH:ubiquinone oxidoreductase subunit A
MAVHVIRKGLDLPISGAPEQQIHPGAPVTRVAVMADDFPFMKPRMQVQVGDVVKRGQLLFEDRKTDGVRHTAPAAGEIVALNRGARRALQSIVIQLSAAEQSDPASAETETFAAYTGADVEAMDGAQVRDLLVESGLWTAIRQRPFSKVPAPTDTCHALFITAINTEPNGLDPQVVYATAAEDFHRGVKALAKLTDGDVFLCRAKGSTIDAGGAAGVKVEEFTGKHPAGLPGTHIHFLAPVNREHVAWYVGLQDVIAVGRLVATGVLDPERVVSLAGPAVTKPRLLRTRLGASIDELTASETSGTDVRTVSGSVLHGRTAAGDVWGYVGRYAQQIAVLGEGHERKFLEWLTPGFKKFSLVRVFGAAWLGRKSFDFTTTTNGGHRSMVPIGMYERVTPLDIMPTFLLRALVANDVERAEALGCLELDEEDLALFTMVSPGKEDFGSDLRRNLTEIWKEG